MKIEHIQPKLIIFIFEQYLLGFSIEEIIFRCSTQNWVFDEEEINEILDELIAINY